MSGTQFEVRKGEPVEKVLKRLKKFLDRENVIQDLRQKRYYEKPSMIKRLRNKRLAFTNMLRERYRKM